MNMHSRIIGRGENFKHTRFGRGAVSLQAHSGEAIPLERIAQLCPSVMATDKHESRSEKYTYIPTIEVLQGLGREGFHPVSVIQGGSGDEVKRAHTKHLIRFRKSTALAVGGTHYEICMLNAHDGTASYQMFAGLFRLVCLNGMCVADSAVKSIKVPHRGDVVGQVIDAAYTVLEQGKLIEDHVDTFRSVTLNRDEQRAFAVAAIAARFGEDEAPIKPEALLIPHRTADQGDDLWRTFNRVQENAIQGGVAYRAEQKVPGADYTRTVHRHTRPVQSVDGNVQVNRALWVLAEETAKLKNAA